MRTFKHFLSVSAACAVACGGIVTSASGQDSSSGIKVGIVDMKRVFSEYYKTKDAEKTVNEGKAAAKRELDERSAKYKQLLEKFQELNAVIRDEAISDQLREEKQLEAQEIAAEAKSLEREMQEFRTRRERMLQETVMRMRKGILEEIRVLVEERSKGQGYDLVFDKSGLSMNAVPFLLHSKDAVDFSDEIIVELNKDAPPSADPVIAPDGPAAPVVTE
ncbi:MAG: OmpH family outer membrane protein [Verrucomicrobiota bacterium]